MLSGFDVSGNSGSVNFAAARNAGHAFCFMRVGRGVVSSATDSSGLDVRWAEYRKQAAAAGLPYGGYWRFYVGVDLATQVSRFATALRQANGMLPPLVDIEDAGNLSPVALTDWAIRALDAVHKATGRRPILYTGQNFLKTSLQQWRFDRWGRCLANWSATAWPDHSAVFWQHKGDVSSGGWAQGNVDLQRFACRIEDLRAHTYEHELVYWVDDDGQLYGPQALWVPLPEGQDERLRATPRRCVLHTMAGWLIRTDEMFRSASVGVESTFGSGHTVDVTQFRDPALDGQIRQWVECDVIANANLDGDQGVPDVISFESSDGGVQRTLSPKQAFTTWQTMAAVCWRYAIPAVELPDSCEGRSGIGWHRLGITGWPATGRYRGKRSNCEPWSKVNAKECPWPMRIDQIVTVGIPTIARILTGVRTSSVPVPVHNPWEDTMDPVTISIANSVPPQFAYICPDGLVVGPLADGAAGIGAFQGLYERKTANSTQVRIVQTQRRLAEFGTSLPVDLDLTQADADQIAAALAAALKPVPVPEPTPPT